MKKTLFSLIVISLIGGITYAYVPDTQGCCVDHDGIKYIGTQGSVLCNDNTVGNCNGTYRGMCKDYGYYGDSAEAYYYTLLSDEFSLSSEIKTIQAQIKQFESIVTNQSIFADSLAKAQSVKTEVTYRDAACKGMEELFIKKMGEIPQTYVCSKYTNIRGDFSPSCAYGYYQYGEPIIKSSVKSNFERAVDMGNKQAKAGVYYEAVSYFQDAKAIIQDIPELAGVISKIDESIADLKEKKETKEILEEVQKNGNIEQQNDNKETGFVNELKNIVKNGVSETELKRAKEYLGDKTIILDSIVDVYNQKDKDTQDKVKKVVEKFTTSEKEYTRSIGIYLLSLIE